MDRKRNDRSANYQITVEGELDAGWAASFDSMTIELESLGGRSVSTLTGPVTDQAALRGMLCRLWDLNLTLISIRRMEALATHQGGRQDG